MQITTEESKETTQIRLAAMLESWRNAAGMSSHDVARAMGVDFRTIRGVERNPALATINTITRYAHACGRDLELAGATPLTKF